MKKSIFIITITLLLVICVFIAIPKSKDIVIDTKLYYFEDMVISDLTPVQDEMSIEINIKATFYVTGKTGTKGFVKLDGKEYIIRDLFFDNNRYYLMMMYSDDYRSADFWTIELENNLESIVCKYDGILWFGLSGTDIINEVSEYFRYKISK